MEGKNGMGSKSVVVAARDIASSYALCAFGLNATGGLHPPYKD